MFNEWLLLAECNEFGRSTHTNTHAELFLWIIQYMEFFAHMLIHSTCVFENDAPNVYICIICMIMIVILNILAVRAPLQFFGSFICLPVQLYAKAYVCVCWFKSVCLINYNKGWLYSLYCENGRGKEREKERLVHIRIMIVIMKSCSSFTCHGSEWDNKRE